MKFVDLLSRMMDYSLMTAEKRQKEISLAIGSAVLTASWTLFLTLVWFGVYLGLVLFVFAATALIPPHHPVNLHAIFDRIAPAHPDLAPFLAVLLAVTLRKCFFVRRSDDEISLVSKH
jgi:hypothetical protein